MGDSKGFENCYHDLMGSRGEYGLTFVSVTGEVHAEALLMLQRKW